MRGINIGDTVVTQDGKHKGVIEKIRTVKNKLTRDLKFEVIIQERKGCRFRCDINDIMIL